MEPQERQMLERLLHISEQNNRLLRKMRREVLIHRFARLAYWIVILVLGVVAYYYITPYFQNVNSLLNSIK
jgi:polyferredoxin